MENYKAYKSKSTYNLQKTVLAESSNFLNIKLSYTKFPAGVGFTPHGSRRNTNNGGLFWYSLPFLF
jgi:hypothetical protein